MARCCNVVSLVRILPSTPFYRAHNQTVGVFQQCLVPLWWLLSTVFGLILIFTGISFAQQSKHQVETSDHELFAPYWTAEAGWHTELQMRNNLSSGDLTVTPVLRNVNGAEFALPQVTVAPNEVITLDVVQALTKSAPQLVGSYGSVVFRYHSPGMRNLYASVMVFDDGHPMAFHLDAFPEATDFDAGSREGIWWLPSPTASDYLVLNNEGNQALNIRLQLYDAKGRGSAQQIVLQGKTINRYSMRELVEKAGLSGTFGGFKLETASKVGSLDTAYFLFDEMAGFSALMKTFDRDPQGKVVPRPGSAETDWTTRAPMLALTNPDPTLGFPTGTVLEPQIFVRNTTVAPLKATLRFNWRGDADAGSSTGPILQLAPYETRRIDVAELQKNQIIPSQAHWASVEINCLCQPNDLMAVDASYDSTLRYGTQTPFNDQLTYHWEGGEWLVDSTHNSIITAGNGGTVSIKAQLTIYYEGGKKRYDLVQELKPHDQMWVDVGKLIHEQIADKNGQTLPGDLTMGSYELQDLTDRGIGNLFEGKVTLDKTYGHVAYGCATCCGFGSSPWMYYDPIAVGVGFTNNQDVWDMDFCTVTQGSVLGFIVPSSWNTANHTIATASNAQVTGVAAGSTTHSAGGTLTIGNVQSRSCPRTPVAPSGPVSSGKKVFLLGTNCGSNQPTGWSGEWGDPKNMLQCGLTDPGPPGSLPPGGSCTTQGTGTTAEGTPKDCYQVTTPTCQTIYCPGDTRVVDSQCLHFLDSFPVKVIKVPAGCS
jgi:hypothetical protein